MGYEHPRREEALKLLAAGKNAEEVADLVGASSSTVRLWRRTAGRAAPKVAPDDLKDMKIAALESRLKQQESLRPQVVPAYQAPPESSPEARWRAAELDNAERISKCLLMAKFSIELPSEPMAITFISDQHISIGNTVDLERMRLDAELVAATDGCYAVLGGDGVENHCKHRSAILAARSSPKDQWELLEWYLDIFAHRVLVAISGNHEAFSVQLSGTDVLGMLLKKNRMCYAPDEAFLDVRVGQQLYKVAVRHQYRMNSSFNETHCVKQYYRNGIEDWDIGCIGHHHVGACEYFYGHGQEKIAVRPGSYQVTSAYSRQYGFNRTTPTCPTVVVYPDRKEMVAFHRLEPALRFLKAERGA